MAKAGFNRTEYQIAQILMRNGIPEFEIENCLKWAFGEDALYVPIHTWDQKWNQRHGNRFMLSGQDSFVDSLILIAKCYCREMGFGEMGIPIINN